MKRNSIEGFKAIAVGLFVVCAMSGYALARSDRFYSLNWGPNFKWVYLTELTRPSRVFVKMTRGEFLQLRQEVQKAEREYCRVRPDPFCVVE